MTDQVLMRAMGCIPFEGRVHDIVGVMEGLMVELMVGLMQDRGQLCLPRLP